MSISSFAGSSGRRGGFDMTPYLFENRPTHDARGNAKCIDGYRNPKAIKSDIDIKWPEFCFWLKHKRRLRFEIPAYWTIDRTLANESYQCKEGFNLPLIPPQKSLLEGKWHGIVDKSSHYCDHLEDDDVSDEFQNVCDILFQYEKDLLQHAKDVPSFKHCRDSCESNKECAGFSFVKSGTDKGCWTFRWTNTQYCERQLQLLLKKEHAVEYFLHHHGYKQPRRQRFVLLGGQPCKRLPLRHGYGVPSPGIQGSNENVPFQGKNAGWRRLQRSKHVPNVSKSCLARIRRDRVEPHPLFQLSSRFGSLQKTLRCISKSHHRNWYMHGYAS